MDCPEHLIFSYPNYPKTSPIGLSIWMYYRDVPRSNIPFKVWCNPLRYQVTIHLLNTRHYTFNREGRYNLVVGNLYYDHVSPLLCRYLGIHKPFNHYGKPTGCHHCSKDRRPDGGLS